ncbi:flagellin B [Sulfuricurvum sp.]|uniref:flagellin B n=1 Tax=Sulfuricurvum sp. TaxID=2025608 RepID=UPI002601EFA2|nr:flagellin B [Sulfuricurvum sp.]MDD2780462.1 flagellin B [Sulfuricurvum sp.]
MGFRINTNIAAMNAHTNANVNNRNLDSSLSKLSSGLRINTAADDASGMSIADSLRSQASTLGQAIANANDGISMIQIADKAMDEQLKILDTIKVKATQAAQDGQTTQSRQALQSDIKRLMESLDNIAKTTSFNGQSLLSGSFTNKEFQVGAYSNQSVGISIGATSSDKIGNARFETTGTVTGSGSVQMSFTNVDGTNSYTLESVKISTSAGTGLGVLAEAINKNSDMLGGVQASFQVVETGSSAIATGTITGLKINNIEIGDIKIEDANDANGVLVAAINNFKDTTGVEASVDSRGHLTLTSRDGRGIQVSGTGLNTVGGLTSAQTENYGRLTLTRVGAADIIVSSSGALQTAIGSSAEATTNLRGVGGQIDQNVASAMGFNANANVQNISAAYKGAGVTTLKGAMAVMKIADSAIQRLDQVRSDLGSVQNALVSTVNNISVTQVNIKAAESQIRDVDFAAESANFSKFNILAQSGSYAMSQANAVQQNVLRLLQ